MNRRPLLIRSVTALSLCLAVVNTFTAQERAEASTPGAAADCGVQQDRLAILEMVGEWMQSNSESIYRATASPFAELPWGRCAAQGNILYLHVFKRPPDGTLLYICGRMDHQLTVLKRGPQNLQRKPSEHLRSLHMDIVSPLPEAMRFALDFSSAEKLLFASDHLWMLPKEILDPFRSLQLPANTESLILRDNAHQLFQL